MSLLQELLLLLSALGNVIFFRGAADESISARAWRQSGESVTWASRRVRIDRALRWLGPDHCRVVYDMTTKRQRARRQPK